MHGRLKGVKCARSMRNVIIATAGGMRATDGLSLIGGLCDVILFLSLRHLKPVPYGCTELSVTLETQRWLL